MLKFKVDIKLLMALASLLSIQLQSIGQKFNQLEIADDSSYVVSEDTLQLEQLIMGNNSTLLLPHGKEYKIIVKTASFGRDCKISGRGYDGKKGDDADTLHFETEAPNSFRAANGNPGKPGEVGGNGATLTLSVINLRKVSRLYIDLQGGRGGDGGAGGRGMDSRLIELAPSDTSTFVKSDIQATNVSKKGKSYLFCYPGSGGKGGDSGKGGDGGNFYFSLGRSSPIYPTIVNVFSDESRRDQGILVINSGGDRGIPGAGGKSGKLSVSPEQKHDSISIYRPNRKIFLFNASSGLVPRDGSKNGTIQTRHINDNCLNERTNSYAIIISVGEIASTGFSSSPQFIQSARKTYSILRQQYYFNQIDTLFNPRSDELDSTLNRIASRDDESSFLIYLTSTGGKQRGQAYFYASDGRKYYFEDLLTRLVSSKSGKLLCLLNSCYSSAIYDTLRTDRQTGESEIIAEQNLCGLGAKTIIYSSARDSMDDIDNFSEAVNDILIRNQRKMIPASELFEALFRLRRDSWQPGLIKVKSASKSDYLFFKN